MGPLALFELASEQVRWLSTRQTVVAKNVANADTPGYRTQDIEPFSSVLNKTALTMSTTSANHIGLGLDQAKGVRPHDATRESWDVFYSGNSVNIEEELLKAGSIARQYSLNTAIVKKLHTLFLSSTKGPG